MLFNSYIFILAFLPVTLLVFFKLGSHSQLLASLWITAASLFFYGWWNPIYLGLLLASVFFNYAIGIALIRLNELRQLRRMNLILIFGVATNLVLLSYYKYAAFFLNNFNHAFDTNFYVKEIILPLGISFFTFTQIAFLVDASQGKAREFNLIHYCLFVTYFPHLIAGPVLHHKEMMPQFANQSIYRINYQNIAGGLAMFSFGLFKKVILADGVSTFVDPAFDLAGKGVALTFLEAWGGALSYTMQLYFDFSGYSDMAIGLSYMFGVKLPLNFNSPYKSVNIIEFWRRWHMTLSRFLRDYLYIPLGGNQKGTYRRYINLFLTMILGGLWHGAGWPFIIWGGLHGAYLVVNHAWIFLCNKLNYSKNPSALGQFIGVTLTFNAVVVGWVFFRASGLDAALHILSGMAGLNGVILPQGWQLQMPAAIVRWISESGMQFGNPGVFQGVIQVLWIGFLLCIVWLMPNTQEVMLKGNPTPNEINNKLNLFPWIHWQLNWKWAVVTAFLGFSAFSNLAQVSQFLYFQF